MVDLQGVSERLNEAIERTIQALNFPGLAIGVTDNERLLFVGDYGLADREKGRRVTSDTIFQIGSISKAFTSIVLLQLQEQGLLSINDPVAHYLPWFEVQSDHAPITLRHLMSHTAGIVIGSDATQSAFTETWSLRHTNATASPGEMFHYSNSGYKALGLILQTLLNQSMADILTERILSPLGMHNTEAVITNAIRPRLAVGYEAYYDDRPLPHGGKLVPATWIEIDTADGSICSTAADMCCYLRALLNRGNGLLETESFDQLIEPVIATGDDLHADQYGLGLCISKEDGQKIISHSGGMVGYTANLLADMDEGFGVIVLTNGPGDPSSIGQYILQLIRAARNGEELPAFPSIDPYLVKNSQDFAGSYHSDGKKFTLTSRGEHLYLTYLGETVQLEPRSQNRFLVPHPAFALFLLCFGRETGANGEDQGHIVEAFHGSDRYARSPHQWETPLEISTEWRAYTGHYRSYNPWLSNFRVVFRKDQLILIHPEGDEEVLHPGKSGFFQVGDDPRSPEFIHFDLLIDGKAQRANYSGGDYCRIFTP